MSALIEKQRTVSRTLEEFNVLRAVDTLEPVTDPYFIPISVRRQHVAILLPPGRGYRTLLILYSRICRRIQTQWDY